MRAVIDVVPYTQVHAGLLRNRNVTITQTVKTKTNGRHSTHVGLGGQKVKNLRGIKYKFDEWINALFNVDIQLAWELVYRYSALNLHQKDGHKSAQVSASAGKAWPNGVEIKVDLRYMRVRLATEDFTTLF